MMAEDPSFTIPEHPQREFPFSGGVSYEGGTMFILTPKTRYERQELVSLVESILSSGPYRWGDFFNLPMPLYLVKDEETTDVFRLSIRDGNIRLHVLPDTDAAGLRAFYDRLRARTDCHWDISTELTD